MEFPGIYAYSGSKHAVTVMTEGLRRELRDLGTNIRVTVSSKSFIRILFPGYFYIIFWVHEKHKYPNNFFFIVKSISPGLVRTEIAVAAGAHPDAVTMMYEQFPVLEPKDISDAVIYSLGTPGRVQVFLHSKSLMWMLNGFYFRFTKSRYTLLVREQR